MEYAYLRILADSIRLGRIEGRHRDADRAVAARRRSQRMQPESLEERIVLSTILPKTSPALIHVMSMNANAAAQGRPALRTQSQTPAYDPYFDSEISTNGSVTVNYNDGSTSQVFQKVSGGWQMTAWNRYELPGMFQTNPVFVQDSWGPNGTLAENIWNLWGHGAPGSTSQYAQLLVQQNQITLTLYHAAGYPIYWGLETKNSQDATVTWTYARAKDGGIGNLLQYHVNDVDTSYSADWIDQAVYNDSSYYASGWLEYYPNHNSIAVPAPLYSGLLTYAQATAKQALAGNAPVAIPPDVTVTHGTVDGHPADTYWDSSHTDSITFVYQGQAKKNLIEQIYGQPVGGKWVTTTDYSTAFISQTATYSQRGGNLETSVTTLTAANGQTATLNGTWTSGTSIANATGVETGSNYLGFGSVTIQFKNGTPVARYGTLQQDLGGFYATDTFNSSGTSIIERDVAAAQGKSNFQTWTGNGGSLSIIWTNPDPSTSIETSKYQLNAPHSDYTGYTMLNFHVALVKPIDFQFNNGDDVNMTTYTWRAFASYSSADGWNWNYRERAQTGREHLAQAYPSTQLPFSNTPDLDQYWNVV